MLPNIELFTPKAQVAGPLLVIILVVFAILTLIRRLVLSPLIKVPGPLYLKLTSAFNKYHEFVGTKRTWLHQLHIRYGPVVTIAPNEVSFSSETGMKQIYSSGTKEFLKTKLYDLFRQDGKINLFTAIDPHQHATIRRPLADRYSNTNILRSKILDTISERAGVFVKLAGGQSSFDIYLYLHGYALDCVTSMLFHPYGTRSMDGTKDREMVHLLSYHDIRRAMVLEYYSPFLSKIWSLLAPPSLSGVKGGRMIRDYVESSLHKNDLSEFTLGTRLLERDDVDMTLAIAECLDHLGAGIETTGDTLCYLMWELSQPRNWARMDKLHQELHVTTSQDRLETLPYLNAVIQESLRMFAPGTLPLPRYVPADGRYIDGYFIPGHTIVGCQSYTLHRAESAFPRPDEFLPERWLDPEGNVERQRLFFAFGLGARTCIGKHLAQAEMRALLYAVYSKHKTRPAPDMDASMEMLDQVLTSRPKDMCCKLSFELYEDITLSE